MHDVQTKFCHDVDFDSNEKISRTQKKIAPNQIDKLLEILNLNYINKIRFFR